MHRPTLIKCLPRDVKIVPTPLVLVNALLQNPLHRTVDGIYRRYTVGRPQRAQNSPAFLRQQIDGLPCSVCRSPALFLWKVLRITVSNFTRCIVAD